MSRSDEQRETSVKSEALELPGVRVATGGSSSPLRHRTRWGETAIQGFLVVCGALSILTTVGIVFGLGR